MSTAASDEAPVVPLLAPAQHADIWARRVTVAVSRGDDSAFRELHDHYRDRTLRFAAVLVRGNVALAEEIVQTVMLTVARKLKPLESDAHLWNWLARVTRQHAAKLGRREQRAAALSQSETTDDCAIAEKADSFLESCMDSALLELEEDDRQLVEWFYFDGLSQKDIAERLATTPKAISGRLDRARGKLRLAVNQKLSYES